MSYKITDIIFQKHQQARGIMDIESVKLKSTPRDTPNSENSETVWTKKNPLYVHEISKIEKLKLLLGMLTRIKSKI